VRTSSQANPDAVALIGDRDALFQFPAADDPEPNARRVLALAMWATALGFAGFIAAARSVITMLTGPVPEWYQSTMVSSGLGCLALTIGAFLTMHRRWAPWVLLVAATLTLLGNLAVSIRGV
jgi:hypothetical protein